MWCVGDTALMPLPRCAFESAPSGLKIFPCTKGGSRVTVACPTEQCRLSPGVVTSGQGGLRCPLLGNQVCVLWIQPFPGVWSSPQCQGQPPTPEDKRVDPAPRSADTFSERPRAWSPSNSTWRCGARCVRAAVLASWESGEENLPAPELWLFCQHIWSSIWNAHQPQPDLATRNLPVLEREKRREKGTAQIKRRRNNKTEQQNAEGIAKKGTKKSRRKSRMEQY